jgi:hypothetical protein
LRGDGGTDESWTCTQLLSDGELENKLEHTGELYRIKTEEFGSSTKGKGGS